MTRYDAINADCRDAVLEMDDESIGAVVTDPPYDLLQSSRRGSRRINNDVSTPFGRHDSRSRGFMGAEWDATGVAFDPETWVKIARVMKPGAHVLSFGGTRTFHRMACAIEDAGFEIRDTIFWIYGQGMPKHGGQLKPACEPIVVARKTFKGSAKRCVEENGVGLLDTAACKIGKGDGGIRSGEAVRDKRYTTDGVTNFSAKPGQRGGGKDGRWPTNVCLDEEVAEFLDDCVGITRSKRGVNRRGQTTGTSIGGHGRYGIAATQEVVSGYDYFGGPSRFFYVAKSSRRERDDGVEGESIHTTVKPIELMQHLVKLVGPRDGVILDPFAGSFSTGVACIEEGIDFIGIEQDAAYVEIGRQRMARRAARKFLNIPL